MKKFLLIFFLFILTTLVFCENYTKEILLNQITESNNELKLLNEEFNQSLIDVKNAKAGLGPTVDLTISGTYLANPPLDKIILNVDDILNNINWPAGIKPNSNGQIITLYDGMENSLYSFQLDITQPIFTWGKITTAISLYQYISEIKQLQILSKKKQLVTELYTRLVSLFYLKEIKTKLENEQLIANKLVKISEDAKTNGLLLEQDVLEAKISSQQIAIALLNVNEQISSLLIGLQKITNNTALTIDNIVTNSNDKNILEFTSLDRTKLETQALDKQQYTFVILEKMKQISECTTKISNASVYWKPDLALKMSLGYGGSRFPFIETDWYKQNDYTANFTVALKTTVWDGGKKLNDITKNKSKEETAKINFEDASLSVRQTLKEEFSTIDLMLSKIEYATLKIQTQDSKILQQEQLYKSGYGSEKDVLQAQIEKINLEIELTQNKLSLAGACYKAAYLSGNELF